MDLGSVRTLVVDLNWAVLGVPITVFLAGVPAGIETRGIWLTYQPEELPTATNLKRGVPRRVLALRRDEVATVPRGTFIEAPPIAGAENQTWIVDGYLEQRDDHHRVIMMLNT